MRFSLVTGLLCLVGVVSASSLDIFESLSATPQGWRKIGAPAKDRRLHFRIALKSPNQDLFDKTLLEVSSPDSSQYGKHLSRQELKRMLRPSAEATDAVREWLGASVVEDRDIDEDGEWINFITTVSQAEKMMDTRFFTYRNTAGALERIRTTQYSLPSNLHKYVDLVQPTTRFGQIRPERTAVHDMKIIGDVNAASTALNVTACNTTITPTCLRELYNIKGYTPSSDSKKSGFIGISGFLEEYARYSDLSTFEAEYAPWAVGTNFTWTSIKGGKLDQTAANDSVEANLDIQYTVGLTAPLHNNYYSTAGRGILVPDLDQPTQADNQNEPYLDYFTYLLSLEDDQLPHTLTSSYGEDEQSIPESYTTKVCNLIGQLGSRGVSVLFSSGDTGPGSACQTNDGKNTTRFLPIFPASCPYVTSVGGTFGVQPERAVSFSSGGFSDRFPRPSYQDDAVSDFLDILGDRWKGLYNRRGRGFPDVAAQGRNFHVIDKGREILVGGTSASSPTFASVVALLNSARKEKGVSPLGFLNPWLYSRGVDGLTDIVNGGSTGCTGRDIYSGLPSPRVPYASWNATKGWDPVTGLGTPDFRKLLELSSFGRYGGHWKKSNS